MDAALFYEGAKGCVEVDEHDTTQLDVDSTNFFTATLGIESPSGPLTLKQIYPYCELVDLASGYFFLNKVPIEDTYLMGRLIYESPQLATITGNGEKFPCRLSFITDAVWDAQVTQTAPYYALATTLTNTFEGVLNPLLVLDNFPNASSSTYSNAVEFHEYDPERPIRVITLTLPDTDGQLTIVAGTTIDGFIRMFVFNSPSEDPSAYDSNSLARIDVGLENNYQINALIPAINNDGVIMLGTSEVADRFGRIALFHVNYQEIREAICTQDPTLALCTTP